jgi:carbamoyltransferase
MGDKIKSSLGISFGYHDSAACLIISEHEIYAEHEERFTRRKFDASFPINCIQWLAEIGKLSGVENCMYYEDPRAKSIRLIRQLLLYGFWDIKLIPNFIKSLLMQKRKVYTTYIKSMLNKNLPGIININFTTHHSSHAASTFYTSSFHDAAILVVDGVGEHFSTSIWVGSGNTLEFIKGERFPNSLGLFYAAFSYYCGFKVNSGEYKFMGLAPYGRPIYKEKIAEKFLVLSKSGAYRIRSGRLGLGRLGAFNMKALENLLGRPKRDSSDQISQFHADIASSIQSILNEIMVTKALWALQVTGKNKLCLAGGVALNCVANQKIVEHIGENSVHFFSASGDAGGALGAAALQFVELNHDQLKNRDFRLKINGSKLGKEYSSETCKRFLVGSNIKFIELSVKQLAEVVAEQINHGKVVGIFSGPSEFGPRALGNRSILADARVHKGQIKINMQIKYRESFRPFAPIVIDEFKSQYFEMNYSSPYMLRTVQVKSFAKVSENIREDNGAISIEQRLNEIDSLIPGVTHLDGSARVQTILSSDKSVTSEILSEFHKITKCPVLINTSFNVRGEPIVGSPQDAINCFMTTGLDYLVLESFLISKKDVLHLRQNYLTKVSED